MKAARRIHAYADALQQGRDSDSPYYKMSGMRTLIADLEEVLASRARYRKRARTEHKAAQNLLAANAALRIENAALQEQLRKERAAVQSARDQRTEATIAALIDLLPPAPQGVAPLNTDGENPWKNATTTYNDLLRKARHRAAYPGEAGDLF